VYRSPGARRPLPDRGRAPPQKLSICSHKIYCCTGELRGRHLARSSLTCTGRAAFRRMTELLRHRHLLGLQPGCRLEEFVYRLHVHAASSLTQDAGQPRLKDDHVDIDYIFRELSVTYLGRQRTGRSVARTTWLCDTLQAPVPPGGEAGEAEFARRTFRPAPVARGLAPPARSLYERNGTKADKVCQPGSRATRATRAPMSVQLTLGARGLRQCDTCCATSGCS